jgi:WD40 repeat protein
MEIFDVPAWSSQWSNNTLFNDEVMACKFGWNGEFAAGDKGGDIYSFKVNNVFRFRNGPNNDDIRALDFSPEGQYFVVSDKVGKLYIYNPSVSNSPINTINYGA